MATLTVIAAFGSYSAGQSITDAATVAAILAGPNAVRVVVTDTADSGSSPGNPGNGSGGSTTPVSPGSIVTPASDLPADFVFAITPDPNNDLPRSTRAIRCQVGGTMVVNTVGGSQAVTLAFADGETRPVRVTRVLSITGCVAVEGMA